MVKESRGLVSELGSLRSGLVYRQEQTLPVSLPERLTHGNPFDGLPCAGSHWTLTGMTAYCCW